jgi:hypothetical protein
MFVTKVEFLIASCCYDLIMFITLVLIMGLVVQVVIMVILVVICGHLGGG